MICLNETVSPAPITASVIVVTLDRPDCLKRCLHCLSQQTHSPVQTIVVDASSDAKSHDVVEQFPGVAYMHNPAGYGHMTMSRNMGLVRATGDVVAMIDDDSFATPTWLENLVAPYADPTVGGVGGRAINSSNDQARVPTGEIGRLKPNGYLAANFSADPGRVIEVDHIVGCNMSFRRDVLGRLGGLRDDFPGTEVGEDTDISLRVRKLGYRVVFNPAAVLLHVGAPQAKGKRFNIRYEFYHRRNNFLLLMRNFGPGSIVWRYLLRTSYDAFREAIRKIAGAVLRVAANFAGAAVGIGAGIAMLARNGRNPARNDAEGRRISEALTHVRAKMPTVDDIQSDLASPSAHREVF